MKAQAWILSITDTVFAAVGEFELVHVLPDNAVLHKVPKAPAYCQQVFIWQNKIIPVMNLATRFALKQKKTTTDQFFISIFAYRTEKTGLLEYGALFLTDTPHRIEVSDEQICPLPIELSAWKHYVRSCFKETDTKKEIPVLRLDRLFSYPQSVSGQIP
jgi:chemotaxis signal transduction protein